MEEEKGAELSWSGESTAKSLVVLSICWGSRQGEEHVKHGLVEKGSATSHIFVLHFLSLLLLIKNCSGELQMKTQEQLDRCVCVCV